MTTSSGEGSERSWTVDDYLQLDEGTRYELLEGELVGMPPPGVAHQHATTRLGTILDSIALAYDLGICFDAPLEVVLGRKTVVQPDLAFFRDDGDYRLLQSRAVVGAPDLIVEVVTPGTAAHVRGVKREIYAGAGVPWLVLVDVQSSMAETYRLTDSGTYSWSETASGDEVLRVPPYPELSIELAKVWPERT